MKKHILRLSILLSLISMCCLLSGCTKDKEENKTSAATSISRTDKIPEEGIVDDMEDYLEIFDE